MNLLKTSELLRSYSMARPECKFNSTDLLILNIVIKYYKSKKPMNLTSAQLSEIVFACEKTVRSSINNLCESGLITKTRVKNRRVVEYIPFNDYI